MATLTNAIN